MKVAVVGSGISGLGSAYLLSRAHDVTVFERDARAGGHANTVHHDGLGLDTGFLVHNPQNYPLLTRLFAELGVRTQPSEMSFSVSCDGCGLEYSGRRPFAQLGNAASPRFYGLLWEIGRWFRTARRSLDRTDYTQHSLGAYLDDQGYSERFRRHFIVPLTSALWSTAPGRALEFPAEYAIRFFDNHGMLGLRRLRWRTVSGGSDTYVRAIAERLGPRLLLGLGARSLRRDPSGVDITTNDGAHHRFDAVVVATHADQALALLEDPTEDELRVLSGFTYTENDAVLHTDQRVLPRARSAWGSWNYRVAGDGRPTVTYYLNRLQAIAGPVDYCLTLNQEIAEEHVIRRIGYEHPLYTVESMQAQRELQTLSGPRRTHYVGAHHGNGFHEDGLSSGVRAASALGVEW